MAVSLLWEVSDLEVELDPVVVWPPAEASDHERWSLLRWLLVSHGLLFLLLRSRLLLLNRSDSSLWRSDDGVGLLWFSLLRRGTLFLVSNKSCLAGGGLGS